MAEEKHLYRTSLRWETERRGRLAAVGLPEIAVATPPEFPGGHPGIWSPEHLFVASAEACLMTTFLAIAGNSKLDYSEYRSEAEGQLEKTEQGFAMTTITIRAHVRIRDEASRERALKILQKAEQHCLISKSMKTLVRVEPEVNIAG
jgi:organic hydroperoxide reductase OsmC/OhrA